MGARKGAATREAKDVTCARCKTLIAAGSRVVTYRREKG
jgi:hypothetical protein